MFTDSKHTKGGISTDAVYHHVLYNKLAHQDIK